MDTSDKDNSNITLETDLMRYTLSPDARVVELTDKRSGKNHLRDPETTYFAQLYKEAAYLERDIHADPARNYLYVVGPLIPTGATSTLPIHASYDNGLLTISFPESNMRFHVTARRDYIIFEVLDELPEGYYSMTFINAQLEFDDMDANAFCAVEYAMNIRVKPHFYPAPMENALRAEVFRHIGSAGAKIAVLSAMNKTLNDVMKSINHEINPREMTISLAGGAYACDQEEGFGTYTIISDVENLSDLPELYKKYKQMAIRQVDFHQGSAFVQGDFHFRDDKYNGKASVFRQLVTEPLKQEGFTSGLHTYAHYISVHCEKYTTDPAAQKQFFTLESLALKQDIGPDDLYIPTRDDASVISTQTGFRVKSSLYLLIDEEIIKFASTSTDGFTSVERGVCATKAAEHKAGATIYHLAHMFGYFMPKIGSKLFYEIARNTADSYNEGGFGMIYIDALDGLSMFEPEYGWYYAATFVLEILNNCIKPPLLEYSTMYPLLWYCRSRCGAWDRAHNGFKRFINEHLYFNTHTPHMYGLPKTLGWYNLCPTKLQDECPARQNPIMFMDDVDMLGARTLAFNQSMAYLNIDDKMLAAFPRLRMNIDRFAQYEKLRCSDYFPETIKVQMRDYNKEFTLLECDVGNFSIAETHYDKEKVYIDDANRDKLHGINPFDKQQPLFRIEGLYTAGDGKPIILQERDANKPINAYPKEVHFNPPLNLIKAQALLVAVQGNGSGDSILIELQHPYYLSASRAYFEIKLDFHDERRFILAEVDNGLFPEGRYIHDGYAYSPYRDSMGTVNYSLIEHIRILTNGSCHGAGLGTIYAMPCKNSSLVNPSLIYNGKRITFCGELNSGEYLDYQPGKDSIAYDYAGNSRLIDTLGVDDITIKNGPFELKLACDHCSRQARAMLTAGFKSKELV